MKVLSPRVHGYVDYCVVALFVLAPTLFGFGGVAASLCYVLAPVHLTVTLLTAFPLGAAKLIPFPVHGVLEGVVAGLLVIAPWLFQFAYIPAAKTFYIVSGVLIGVVVLMTDYSAVYSPGAHRPRYGSVRRSFS